MGTACAVLLEWCPSKFYAGAVQNVASASLTGNNMAAAEGNVDDAFHDLYVGLRLGAASCECLLSRAATAPLLVCMRPSSMRTAGSSSARSLHAPTTGAILLRYASWNAAATPSSQ